MSFGKNNYPPLVIFAYNRPKKLENLLLSLTQNKELEYIDVYFFVDRGIDKVNIEKNKKVIDVINKDWNCKSKKIIFNTENFGLKRNILNGINETFKKYESAIFLEDDLIVSKSFLDFMIKSLIMYQKNEKIMHISGYNFPNFFGHSSSSYLSPFMNCWGWATWKDRWQKNINFNENLISSLTKKERRRFNIYGFEKDYESQLIRNENKKIKTWAIFWYQFIYLNQGLCLQPVKSLVQNTGMDGSGVHNSDQKVYEGKINNLFIKNFPKKNIFKLFYKIQIISFYINKNLRKKLNI
tara:strand:+ start:106 stop:993 length:888 start_codon:yes stop_codon:yes gene_type:complete